MDCNRAAKDVFGKLSEQNALSATAILALDHQMEQPASKPSLSSTIIHMCSVRNKQS
jgi:hypothetical protein